jgi:hypothetical protein
MGNARSFDERVAASVEHQLAIRELQNEIQSLKHDNDALRKSLSVNRDVSGANDHAKSVVSSTAIDDFVEGLLADPETNIGYVPDAIERSLERKMLLVLMKSVAQLVDSASIKFMGHEIVLEMRPVKTELKSKLLESPRVQNLKSLMN